MDGVLRTQRSAAWTRGIQLCACLPFLLSVVFHTVGVTATQPVGSVELSPLTFDQYLVNLREVEPSNLVPARFSFTNSSQRPVTIKEMRPSCGCLRPQLEQNKTVYEPGERGTFWLRVLTANEKPGPREYFCDVRYEEQGQARETRVTFKVVLPEKTVTVTPKALYFFQGNATPTEREIVVSNFTGQELDLLEVDCSSELAKVAIADPEFDPFGRRIHKIKVTVAAVPPGQHAALVTILTDHPTFSELRVPLQLEAPGAFRHARGHDLRNSASIK